MNPQHTGTVKVLGQPPQRLLAEIQYDPFSRQAQTEAGGSLLAHYQPPLTDGRDVFLVAKGGEYVSCNPPGSGFPRPCGANAWNRQIWMMKRFQWRDGRLTERWKFESDWKPVPNGGVAGWEPVFHGALTESDIWVPASGGEVFQLRRRDGMIRKRHQPFGVTDPNRYTVSPITVDDAGNVIYNVLQLDAANPWNSDAVGAWIVKISPSGSVTMSSYRQLVPEAPTACKGTFNGELPWPPSPTAVPPSIPCFSQRPGINAAPAVAPDGTIYVVSRAHNSGRYSYLIALNPDLSRKWAASLRDRLKDGCGGILPIGGPNGCRPGTPPSGVDPATNESPAAQVSDLSTASPVVAPDGSILYGAFSGYNYFRGHLLHFDSRGEFLQAFDFGWDSTPAVWEHDGTYSVIIKENNYEAGSYCSNFQFCPPRENGPYYITQLNSKLDVEWRFQNTNTQECSRQPGGSLACRPAKPGGFEWCINAPAVDVLGNVYANSEDGNLYVIGQGGKLISSFFLNLAIGAAYTPLSIGYDGKIYTENDGIAFVVGR